MPDRGDAAPAGPTRPVAGGAAVFAAVAATVFASRLPFLGPGYGVDADAWRVAWSAHTLATTGAYEASRFPGYPVQEIGSALLIRGGPVALVGVTALLAAIAAGFLALIVRRLGGRDAFLAGVAFGSVPAFALASIQSMDYAWALAFALAALHQALAGRAMRAGVLVGLAIGCRLTSVLWLVPVAFALAHGRPRAGGAIARAAATAVAVGALAFVPVVRAHGPGFLRFYEDGYPPLAIVLKNAALDLWGIPGLIALAVALPLALARPAARTSTPAAGNGVVLAGAAAGVAAFAAAFLRLPHEAAYLLPAAALVVPVLGMRIDRRLFIAVCVALVISPWLLDVVERRGSGGVPPSRWAVPIGATPYALDLRGPLPTAQARRVHTMRRLERALAAADRLEGPAVIVAWEWLPLVRVAIGGKTRRAVRYDYLLTADSLRALGTRGVPVYFLDGADVFDARVHGVDLRAAGARPLDAPP
jgi:hypothetical protein